jgi:3-deoxy-manno-octulosonate cytidylyltransferase (CMP-KDO synthetase)
MRVVGIIPARLNSTRLPGKLLLDINGKTMIQRVYENVLQSNLDKVIVACDEQKIYDAVVSFGGCAMMTDKNHINGSTRIAEVAKNIDADYIINVQGDEPLISADVINNLINEIDQNDNVITLKYKLDNDIAIDNPNNVKVITDNYNNAIYFSRSRIPYNRGEFVNYYKHIGIYCYKKDFLLKYTNMNPTILEEAESLEQLRILENGYKIKVIETNHSLIGVDTIEDLEVVRNILK